MEKERNVERQVEELHTLGGSATIAPSNFHEKRGCLDRKKLRINLDDIVLFMGESR